MIRRQLTVMIVTATIAFMVMMSFVQRKAVIPYAAGAAIGNLYTNYVPIPTLRPTLTVSPEPKPEVLIGAGDIALCDNDGDTRTAAVIERLLKKYPQATIFTAGDNAQVKGDVSEYTDCFNATWGRFKDRIRPSPGNHDWYTDEGEPYFAYFGSAAGKNGLGYYSYDLGAWHIVSLNSNCDRVDCGALSPQAQWLREDLQSNSSRCTLLYWHHPLWDSGKVEVASDAITFWRIASEYGAEVVVNGHDHHYERFTPLDRFGKVNRVSGLRTFIVGTGGAWLFDLGRPLPITEVRNNRTKGVIQFLLYPNRYEWKFVPEDGGRFTDAGSGVCH